MIPTRLNQHYKNGKIAGFNPSTGNLVVVHNSAQFRNSFFIQHFKREMEVSLIDLPDWVWPSYNDLQTIVKYSRESIFYRLSEVNARKQFFLLSRSVDCVYGMRYVSVYRAEMTLKIKSKCSKFLGFVRNGVVLPVRYINYSHLNQKDES